MDHCMPKCGICEIVRIEAGSLQPFVPPLSDYCAPSAGWSEAEYRASVIGPSDRSIVGYWTGEPGEVSFESWPYTEVCAILSGKVGLRDLSGDTMEFDAGQGFLVPKGWAGTWITIEPSRKIFVAIE